MGLSEAKGLSAEIDEISTLECMVSMDSANQHIASLVSTPVVSLWGATHPAAGLWLSDRKKKTASVSRWDVVHARSMGRSLVTGVIMPVCTTWISQRSWHTSCVIRPKRCRTIDKKSRTT
ncbi:glycosyltransferase family 9 protein [Porphyromonas cangingivalis]|uniref:glycosyltransferase family 9 protein n=1 Tax=Porphyromonas cangingivalis TaxID=36874 RepID=UPI0011DCC563|nr:glycosyltransferase family 9 protein [Porphyromonas cangingivalis]